MVPATATLETVPAAGELSEAEQLLASLRQKMPQLSLPAIDKPYKAGEAGLFGLAEADLDDVPFTSQRNLKVGSGRTAAYAAPRPAPGTAVGG